MTDLRTGLVEARITDLPDKFVANIDPSSDGCWLWTGGLGRGGYGNVRWDGKTLKAHRATFQLLVGPIPAGLVIDHLCRVRACVNPAHMEPVTLQENIRRGKGGQNQAQKTHCPLGHPYNTENTYLRPAGRECRVCHRLRMRRRRAAGIR